MKKRQEVVVKNLDKFKGRSKWRRAKEAINAEKAKEIRENHKIVKAQVAARE